MGLEGIRHRQIMFKQIELIRGRGGLSKWQGVKMFLGLMKTKSVRKYKIIHPAVSPFPGELQVECTDAVKVKLRMAPGVGSGVCVCVWGRGEAVVEEGSGEA